MAWLIARSYSSGWTSMCLTRFDTLSGFMWPTTFFTALPRFMRPGNDLCANVEFLEVSMVTYKRSASAVVKKFWHRYKIIRFHLLLIWLLIGLYDRKIFLFVNAMPNCNTAWISKSVLDYTYIILYPGIYLNVNVWYSNACEPVRNFLLGEIHYVYYSLESFQQSEWTKSYLTGE